MTKEGANTGTAAAIHFAIGVITDQNAQTLRHNLNLQIVLRLHLLRKITDKPGKLLHLMLTFQLADQ